MSNELQKVNDNINITAIIENEISIKYILFFKLIVLTNLCFHNDQNKLLNSECAFMLIYNHKIL